MMKEDVIGCIAAIKQMYLATVCVRKLAEVDSELNGLCALANNVLDEVRHIVNIGIHRLEDVDIRWSLTDRAHELRNEARRLVRSDKKYANLKDQAECVTCPWCAIINMRAARLIRNERCIRL